MKRQVVVPQELKSYYVDWKMSPGMVSGQHVFFSGFTGASADGSLSSDPEIQMKNAFEKIGFVLRDANLDFSSVSCFARTKCSTFAKNSLDVARQFCPVGFDT
ncbi:hypothetical protein [Maritalea porphyrae]|uniref:RidA family protein n=1 Tax=Maritalea porphyrae TaxID=880732 RepID=A0ABQ5UMT5_9HYPH|nr:hypothetical protein [Maritalea porphyrae]GLQ16452.1 hypothetical protein GCM10007879_07010 [Maritalea porphyrae]